MAKTKVFILLSAALLTACHSRESSQKSQLVDHDMSRAKIDIELPTTLWDRIDAVYHEDTKAEKKSESEPEKQPEAKKVAKEVAKEVAGEVGQTLLEEITKEYVPLTVILTEKPDNRGILQSHDHQLYFDPGGGVLDLADFVENRRGSYYFKVIFGKGKSENKKEEASAIDFSKENVKVFFLSNSRLRKWDGKIVGSGCKKYFDISKFFEKSMKGQGFLLNTTNHLDLSSLAGSFFFTAQVNRTLYISQLSIKDSRFNSLQCRSMLSKAQSL